MIDIKVSDLLVLLPYFDNCVVVRTAGILSKNCPSVCSNAGETLMATGIPFVVLVWVLATVVLEDLSGSTCTYRISLLRKTYLCSCRCLLLTSYPRQCGGTELRELLRTTALAVLVTTTLVVPQRQGKIEMQ